tara:strand:+ start:298 stop:450 length:153 start_codon:yes stop_codon:yes gene_type:complete
MKWPIEINNTGIKEINVALTNNNFERLIEIEDSISLSVQCAMTFRTYFEM